MTVQQNGQKRERLSADLVFNLLMATHKQSGPPSWLLSRGANAGLDPTGRDLDKECGYIENPTIEQYTQFYDRVGIASRVVNIWPDECWGSYPELYQTEDPRRTRFEKAWDDLSEKVLPWHYLHRIDRLSGIGSFGVLFLGLNDGRTLDRPAAGLNPTTGEPFDNRKGLQLLYLRAFDESVVKVSKLISDPNSPRFGQPEMYQIDFSDPSGAATTDAGLLATSIQREVHWTRIIHVADNRKTSEVGGLPRLHQVLNLISDIRKVAGSSAEMFWKGGFPGYAFQTDPDLSGEAAINEEEVADAVQSYVNGLKRYLTAVGGSWKSLAPQVADPSKNLQQLLTLLCATIGVPLRIFLGTESGHLASTQDAGTWKERLRGRQLNYLEPMLVKPFVARLMDLGCLPRVKKYLINWRDLQTLGDKDRAEVALKKTQAIMQYVTGNCEQKFPFQLFLTLILGVTDKEAAAVIAELKRNPPPPPVLPPAPANPQGGGRTGNPAKKSVGRPSGPPSSNK